MELCEFLGVLVSAGMSFSFHDSRFKFDITYSKRTDTIYTFSIKYRMRREGKDVCRM